MKKFLKCLYICAAAFLCFSCSNLMNNGSATLILDFSGESPERYISSNNTGDIECSSLEMQGDSTFFEIKLKGPVTKKYRINYLDENRQPVERLVMDGLVSGRYKMSVLIGNSFFDCTYYGEKDITVYPGANHKNFDVFKLIFSNLKTVTGAKIIIEYQEGFNPFLNHNRISVLTNDSSTFKIEGAHVTYDGGFSEVLDNTEAEKFGNEAEFFGVGAEFRNADYSVYHGGVLLGRRSDLITNFIDLDYTKNGYYIIFKFNEGFTLRADIEFEPM